MTSHTTATQLWQMTMQCILQEMQRTVRLYQLNIPKFLTATVLAFLQSVLGTAYHMTSQCYQILTVLKPNLNQFYCLLNNSASVTELLT